MFCPYRMLTEKNWRVTSVSAGLAGSGFPFQGDPLELWRWWEAGSEERQRQEPTREGPAWQLLLSRGPWDAGEVTPIRVRVKPLDLSPWLRFTNAVNPSVASPSLTVTKEKSLLPESLLAGSREVARRRALRHGQACPPPRP